MTSLGVVQSRPKEQGERGMSTSLCRYSSTCVLVLGAQWCKDTPCFCMQCHLLVCVVLLSSLPYQPQVSRAYSPLYALLRAVCISQLCRVVVTPSGGGGSKTRQASCMGRDWRACTMLCMHPFLVLFECVCCCFFVSIHSRSDMWACSRHTVHVMQCSLLAQCLLPFVQQQRYPLSALWHEMHGSRDAFGDCCASSSHKR
jgi:hypothetical protein